MMTWEPATPRDRVAATVMRYEEELRLARERERQAREEMRRAARRVEEAETSFRLATRQLDWVG